MNVKNIVEKFVSLCYGSRRISIRGTSQLSLGKNGILSSGEIFFEKSSGHSDELWYSLIELHDNGGNWNTSSSGLVLSKCGESKVAEIISKHEKPEPVKRKRKFAKKTKSELTESSVAANQSEVFGTDGPECSGGTS